ncbi:SRPBCC family protein [Pseudonocardia sp. CA-107938]|uniref:SRPBCC family protein n=1 Tax=Pseudonocardia sp. CA-107938 TaxID=3240021 RepID=UPI003D93D38F
MQLENTFTIAAPIDKAWKALNTPETVAPCFPGATLTEYEGDEFSGTVKVKLGPISLTYKGKGVYKERDDANHRVVIDASGRDSRGNGTASALVTGTLVADGPDKTSVTMVTDMTITGKPAQFGRGVINDVANKIIGQFAACVAEKLTDDTGEAAAEEPAEEPAAATAATNGAAVSTSDVPTTTTPEPITKPAAVQPKPPMRSDVDAIDLLDTAGAPVLKRLAPVIGGVLVLLILLAIRRNRSAA